jgi:hypothetical protein
VAFTTGIGEAIDRSAELAMRAFSQVIVDAWLFAIA